MKADSPSSSAVRRLPGMTRAVLRTLRKIWDADFELSAAGGGGHCRIAEMSLIEARLKARLPLAAMMPRDLRDTALKRVQHAPRAFGAVRIAGLSFIAPVWRPLIEALRDVVPVEWMAPAEADTDWFRGKVLRGDTSLAKTPAVVSCADVRHEVVESLRWARQLIASGIAKPNEIAIASANTAAWDDHFLASAEGTVTSAVVEEIPEGSWAQTGQIRRLPEVAAIAQFEHLARIEMQR